MLARLSWQGDEATAEIIRVLRREPRRLVGLLQRGPGGLLLEPTGDGGRSELLVREQDNAWAPARATSWSPSALRARRSDAVGPR